MNPKVASSRDVSMKEDGSDENDESIGDVSMNPRTFPRNDDVSMSTSDALIPDRCATNQYRDLVVVITDSGARCYEREELLARSDQYDYLAKVVLKRFPTVQIFQEFGKEGEKVLRPLRGSVEDYLSRMISSSQLLSNVYPNILGEGAFGIVWQHGDLPIVVKNIDSDKDLDSITEFSIMKVIQNSPCCVLTSHDLHFEGEKARIYLPKMKSDLSKYLKTEYDPDEQSQILHDLVKGVYFLNRKGFMHRDLKFENCLITEEGEAKVADFGLGCFYPYQLHAQNFTILTWTYRAPEVSLRQAYSSAVDVFSLGMMALETVSRRPHHVSYFSSLVSNQVLLSRYPSVRPKDADHLLSMMGSLYDLVTEREVEKSDLINEMYLPNVNTNDYYFNVMVMQMLCNLPHVRPTLFEVLQHPYFQGYRNEDRDVTDFSLANVMAESPCYRNGRGYLDFKAIVLLLGKISSFPAVDLLALAILKKYASINPDMGMQQLYPCLGALYLASKLSHFPITSKAIGSAPAKTAALQIAVALDFQFNHLTILHFFRGQPSAAFYRDLLVYELGREQPFSAHSVAQYLEVKHSANMIVDLPLEPIDEAVMERLLAPTSHEEQITLIATRYSTQSLNYYLFDNAEEDTQYDRFLNQANTALMSRLSRNHVLEGLTTFDHVLEHIRQYGIGEHNYLAIGSTLVFNVPNKTRAALPLFKQVYDYHMGGGMIENLEEDDKMSYRSEPQGHSGYD